MFDDAVTATATAAITTTATAADLTPFDNFYERIHTPRAQVCKMANERICVMMRTMRHTQPTAENTLSRVCDIKMVCMADI